jgi:acetyltransferase-like isoleucine patch superfamily enzyme/acyl carrier protein
MTVTADEVRTAILARVQKPVAALGLAADTLPDDFDLLKEGVIDSFGLLELISSIEDEFGLAVDFESIDAVDLTAIGPFSRFVATAAANGAEPHQLATGTGAATRPVARIAPAHRKSLGSTLARAYAQGTRVRDKLFSLSVARAFAEFGPRSVIQLPTRLVNEHRIAVGSGVFIGANSWLQVLESDGDVALSIGNGVSVSGNLVLSASESLRVGDNVSFARNVYVADHSHAYTDPSLPILAQGIDDIAPVEIAEGAWLGQNVVVLGGVRIGRNAVISAGSVVTSDVGDHCLAMGAPARVVRRFGTTG